MATIDMPVISRRFINKAPLYVNEKTLRLV